MFRFTIRDVLWLTVVMGMLTGFWLQRAELVKELEQQKAQLRDMKLRADVEAYRTALLQVQSVQNAQPAKN